MSAGRRTRQTARLRPSRSGIARRDSFTSLRETAASSLELFDPLRLQPRRCRSPGRRRTSARGLFRLECGRRKVSRRDDRSALCRPHKAPAPSSKSLFCPTSGLPRRLPGVPGLLGLRAGSRFGVGGGNGAGLASGSFGFLLLRHLHRRAQAASRPRTPRHRAFGRFSFRFPDFPVKRPIRDRQDRDGGDGRSRSIFMGSFDRRAPGSGSFCGAPSRSPAGGPVFSSSRRPGPRSFTSDAGRVVTAPPDSFASQLPDGFLHGLRRLRARSL